MIPKIIHYCWFGGKPLPRMARRCISSWKRMCPDYKIIRWDETNFDVHQSSFVSTAYDAGAWAFVSDWVRLKVVHDFGGVYLDTDVELIKPLDELLDNSCYIGVQQPARLCTTGLGFGACKESPVVREMLAQYDGLKFTWHDSRQLACPYLNDRVVRAHGYIGDGTGEIAHLDGVTVYPCRYFDPISTGDSLNLMSDATISKSLYAHSWGTGKEKLRRVLVNLIGTETAQKIKSWIRHE